MIKVSTELPVAIRHFSDMTENLLKATFNPNKQQQQLRVSFMSLHVVLQVVTCYLMPRWADSGGVFAQTTIHAFIRCISNT